MMSSALNGWVLSGKTTQSSPTSMRRTVRLVGASANSTWWAFRRYQPFWLLFLAIRLSLRASHDGAQCDAGPALCDAW